MGLTKGVDGRFKSIAAFGSYPPVNHQVDCLGVGFALIHGCLGILDVGDFGALAMSEKSESLNYQDVVSLTDPKVALVLSQQTFRVSELAAALVDKVLGSETVPFRPNPKREWSASGVAAEVLAGSKGWRKGKVRLTVEFIPDEGEDEPVEQ